jgi:uncharacterized protein (TIGR02145 family)
MDANGGINFLTMGTTQLLSVPYAMHAKTAGSIVGGSNQVFIQAGNNVTVTGTGTSVDPYIINSTATGSASGLVVTPGNGVTDIDGNNYTTMIYGNQEWMTQNLRTTRYANGDPIQNITGNSQWQGATATGAWSHYNNDSQYDSDYGKLYNLAAVTDSRNACPIGWHVANQSDLNGLLAYLGGTDNAGGRMKNTGTQYWQSPNNLATNESGFSALPGGFRSSNGIFGSEGVDARFWAVEEQFGGGGFYRLNHLIGVVDLGSLQVFLQGSASPGVSVRCIKN